MRTIPYASLWLAISLWAACNATVSAQDPNDPAAPQLEAPSTLSSSQTIGGMPDEPRSYQYTSPLKKLGFNIGVGTYAVTALVSIIYMIDVYPLQELFGDATFEPVMPWLLIPIAGPLIAQYEDHVIHKPGWRALLIGDAALQAGGVLIGLLGLILSGERTREPERASGFDLQLGAAGVGLTGLTVSFKTL